MTKSSKLNKSQLKELYGYSPTEERLMYKYNPSIPRGNFIIFKNKKGIHYWYFQLGIKRPQDTTRMKYITKCYEGKNQDGETSFEVCIQKLIQKVGDNFTKKIQTNTKVSTLCDEFIGTILLEERDRTNRKQETTSSIKNGVRQFKEWLLLRDTRLNEILDPRKLKDIVKEYLNHLGERKSQSGKQGLSHNTKRTYLKQVRYFFEWCEDEDIGKGILPSNPITRDFCKKILPPSHQERTGVSERNFMYESQWYDKMYNSCVKKVRDLWSEFIEHGHSRTHTNQPLGVGSDIVWFGSLFQLDSGFRIGEVLKSYRSRDYFLHSQDRMNNSSYTYWDYRDDTWNLFMYWKGKESVVPITTQIRSWKKPKFDGIKYREGGTGKSKYWDTNIVDVCLKMFRDSPFLFSSPMRKRNKLGHYSQTQYSTNFKNILSCKGEYSMGWERYGVFTSHDLRDYFITHKLNSGFSIEDVSSITRNSIQTIEKYYLRMDIKGQLKRQKKLDSTRKILSDRELKNRGLNE